MPAMPPFTTAAPTAESKSGSRRTRLGGPAIISQSALRLCLTFGQRTGHSGTTVSVN